MRLALGSLIGLVATAASAQSNVVHVKNYGEDSPDCGAQVQPCRSISQGIRRANEHDTVLVGPGIYGDLNRNGVVGEAGEEWTGQLCLVCMGETITVLSERGAAHTTIDARNLALRAVVRVGGSSSPAVFGYAEQGFTVLVGEGMGIELIRLSTAWGNRVVGGTIGIYTDWPGTKIYENEVTDAAGIGISLGGSAVSSGGSLYGNVVARNGAGIYTVRGSLVNNTIADNRGPGAVIEDPFHGTSIVRNVFIRNRGAGLVLRRGPFPDVTNATVVDSNDFIGNDPERQCGVQNDMGDGPVWAVNNFWAAAPDFGVTEQIVCNGPSSSTIIDPPRLQPH